LIEEILTEANPQNILEIGVESGKVSRKLFDWVKKNNAKLYSIDPSDLDGERIIDEDFVRIYNSSLSDYVKPLLKSADICIIDGDHNWYTVYNELKLIYEGRTQEKLPIVFLHDVSWPCARRDQYYYPESIPALFRHDHSFTAGIKPGFSGVFNNRGFRGNGSWAVALKEGGQKNGVLTAIEDFLMGIELDIKFRKIDMFCGLGILYYSENSTDNYEKIIDVYYSPYLEEMERNRMDNYIRVLDLQDNINSLKKAT